MRSDVLCEALRKDKAEKRIAGKRKSRKMYMRRYRKRQKAERAIMVSPHPTLPLDEALALKAVIAWESGKQRTDAHVFAPEQAESVLQTSPQSVIQPAVVPTDVIRPEARHAPDCLAALLEHEERVAPQIKALQALKYGQPQPEPKIEAPRPFDLPNGIIL